ncbi:MAG: GNAT family N-acetyltransferase [Clostridiaceae bacterium]|jgi:predicted acetyltransferase|nr:GNAT family N-acetyltransferase [Clostridiaceae bacterium]
MIKEYQDEGKSRNVDLEELSANFCAHVQEILSWEVRHRPDRVKETELWLIESNECIGTVRIRHELNNNLVNIGGHIGYGIRPSRRGRGYGKIILKLALDECKKMGILKVLITCSPDNIASKKIIEYNGGLLENEIYAKLDGKTRRTLRYWIYL